MHRRTPHIHHHRAFPKPYIPSIEPYTQSIVHIHIVHIHFEYVQTSPRTATHPTSSATASCLDLTQLSLSSVAPASSLVPAPPRPLLAPVAARVAGPPRVELPLTAAPEVLRLLTTCRSGLCIYIYIYIHMCIHVYTYMCMCVCVWAYIYI